MSTLNDRIRKKITAFEKFVSRKQFTVLFESLVILTFVCFVLAPPLNLMRFILSDWTDIRQLIFEDPILKNTVWIAMFRAISLSFQIAFVVTLIDVIIGIPIAHVMANYEFRGKTVLDTIIDLPLAVPTSALGFSVLLFWGTRDGLALLMPTDQGLFDQGQMMLILGHVAFSFSYVVRNLKGVLEEVDPKIVAAGRTLGGSPFSVFRTVSAPMAKEGIIAGGILAFTRSLGETGASIILAGVYETAPIQIVSFMNGFRVPQAAFLSIVLITVSISLLVGVRQYARKVGIPQPKIYPEFERLLSNKRVSQGRNSIVWTMFFGMVFVPSLFVLVYLARVWNHGPNGDVENGALYQIFDAPDNKWETLQLSITISIEVALVVTIINLILGIPMAYLLVNRKYWGRGRIILDALVDIPLVIPSSALGFAVFLLWGNLGLQLVNPGVGMIILAHLTFTYPFSVRPMISYFENYDYSYYEAARTLGASEFTAFRRVIIPMMKRGIFSSAILTFTRSLSETGATLIVMGNSRTVPVLIVDLVESESLPAAAFAASVLIFLSFVLLFIVRMTNVTKQEK